MNVYIKKHTGKVIWILTGLQRKFVDEINDIRNYWGGVDDDIVCLGFFTSLDDMNLALENYKKNNFLNKKHKKYVEIN